MDPMLVGLDVGFLDGQDFRFGWGDRKLRLPLVSCRTLLETRTSIFARKSLRFTAF